MISRSKPNGTGATPTGAADAVQGYVVGGRCMLPSGDEYQCVAKEITSEGAEIIMKASADVGTSAICYLDNIGIVKGTVRQAHDQGFHLTFDMNDLRRLRVAARIQWHETRAAETAEKRAAPRIVPLQQHTQVWLAENVVYKARIINLSMSGVAFTIDGEVQLFIGSLIRVGKRFATVVRLLNGGIGAEFKLPFTRETFNEHVIL